MRTNIIATAFFFISGYIPLFIIIMINNRNLNNFFLLISVSAFSLASLYGLIIGSTKDTHAIKIKQAKADLNLSWLYYFIPYAAVFVSTDLLLLVFSIMISGALSIKNKTIFIHPVLFFLGYRFYTCSFIEGSTVKTKILISNKKINNTGFARYKLITNEIGFLRITNVQN